MATADSSAPLLTLRNLSKSHFKRRSPFHAGHEVVAVRGVNLELSRGSTLAIVGNSGAGKSTLARCIAGLERPTSGEIWFDGRKIERAGERRVQLIFQDPGASFNSRFSVARALSEPCSIRLGRRPDDNVQRLEQVGLSATLLNQPVGQLSGGQKARLALARALAALGGHGEPCLLILDESLSSLDLSVEAQIINLLVDLQARFPLTYIFIAHDLSLAGHMADDVAVMFEGEIVERGAPRAVFGSPRHPEVKSLVNAALALSLGSDGDA